jgi:hypothetical protein
MYYVELDTNNLAKWFRAVAPYAAGTGGTAKNDNGGYIVYFSDRRNNRNTSTGATADARFADNAETGEFGYEDIINPAVSDGWTDSGGSPNAGEDVNADTVLQTYGKLPNGGTGTASTMPPGAASPLDAGRERASQHDVQQRQHGQERAARQPGDHLPPRVEVDRRRGPPDLRDQRSDDRLGESGLRRGELQLDRHRHGQRWNDISSFNAGTATAQVSNGAAHAGPGLVAANATGYRFAAVMGKNISFASSTASGWTPQTNFGMDGGAHNLLRVQEDWQGKTIIYRGSIVSFFISRQAVGIFKCCNFVYDPPDDRKYFFDSDFLLPDKLPPGTPMFRDVNTLTFRQILRPNQ